MVSIHSAHQILGHSEVLVVGRVPKEIGVSTPMNQWTDGTDEPPTKPVVVLTQEALNAGAEGMWWSRRNTLILTQGRTLPQWAELDLDTKQLFLKDAHHCLTRALPYIEIKEEPVAPDPSSEASFGLGGEASGGPIILNGFNDRMARRAAQHRRGSEGT